MRPIHSDRRPRRHHPRLPSAPAIALVSDGSHVAAEHQARLVACVCLSDRIMAAELSRRGGVMAESLRFCQNSRCRVLTHLAGRWETKPVKRVTVRVFQRDCSGLFVACA